MKTKTLAPILPSLSALALLSLACGGAAAPSTELVAARSAYNQARSSEAAQLNPRGVHEAYQALSAAEAVHEDDAGSRREQHYAYIAARKSELAIAQASEELARREQQRADATYKATLEQTSKQAAQQSSDFAQQLSLTQQQLQQNSEQLEQARANAQRAEAQLRKEEALREDAGRLVISLSGVLFESGGARLSPSAEQRLDTIVQALGSYSDRAITIDGYTDSQGSTATNQDLSQRRADAVREYLEQRGVEPGRIRAVGKGETNPVASNDTAEGRATNRRVEIIVERQGDGREAREPDMAEPQPGTGSDPAAVPPASNATGQPSEKTPQRGQSLSPSAQAAPRTP